MSQGILAVQCPTAPEALPEATLERPVVNRLLRAFGAAGLPLVRAAEVRNLAAGEVINDREGNDLVYFPESGLIGLQACTVDGLAPVVGYVGVEGALGLCAALGGPVRALEFAPITASRLLVVPGAKFRNALFANIDAMRAVLLYLAKAEEQARRNAMCASLHSGMARLADRLLSLSRTSGANRVPVTQEALGLSLGLARTTVTAFVQDLKDAGMTRHGRGWIGILQPDVLATVACGCSTIDEAR